MGSSYSKEQQKKPVRSIYDWIPIIVVDVTLDSFFYFS